MKCTTIIDKEHEEEIIIYSRERTELVDRIERICSSADEGFLGFRASEIVRLSPEDVQLFTIRDGKVYAICDTEEYQLRERLYTIEERVGAGFVKINQSCLASISKIARFEASVGGALSVVFKNGSRDYVSRRQLKTVKRAIGI